MFSNRRKLARLADPRLRGKFPMRGLYQALAVASMCIQEQAVTRPLIADVVTALSYLSSHTYDSDAAQDSTVAGIGRDLDAMRDVRREERNGRRSSRNENSSIKKHLNQKDLDREKAVAEAKLWGENLRRANAQINSNDSNPV